MFPAPIADFSHFVNLQWNNLLYWSILPCSHAGL